MFQPSDKPRLFGLPCGVNFASAVRDGLLAHFGQDGPEMLARTEIFVNTSRMRRDILDAFTDGPTRLLPRVRLVTDLVRDPKYREGPLPLSPLKLRLELAQLVTGFLEREPDFADRVSIHGLADSLALLLGEMHDEQVSYETLTKLDVRNISDHWGKALEFIGLIKRYYDEAEGTAPIAEARLRAIVDKLETAWAHTAPSHPVLVIGSTGSRGTTAQFMDLVARLPQGAVVYPGVDFEMPNSVWKRIDSGDFRDHPQERVIRMARRLGLEQSDIQPFADTSAPCPPRNALLSLALRPAPVTDEWMRDGPLLPEITRACENVTLIEAPDPRTEASAIALVLRKAAETKTRAALITPDRDLARQVTACLDRWDIDPEDSAGVPLNQTAPGRLFRHIAGIFGRPVIAPELLVILKHPLVSSASSEDQDGDTAHGERGQHFLWTRSLELFLRRQQSNTISRDILERWAKRPTEITERAARQEWISWVIGALLGHDQTAPLPLDTHLHRLLNCASSLVRGPHGEDDSNLWRDLDGRAMRLLFDRLIAVSDAGGDMTPREFEDFFRTVLGREMSRDPTPRHPNVMIWGTLEARSLDAELVILGGLNDGIWPQHPTADPWFNRELRKSAGLLSPDQMVGLSAHDFEQAFCAREVVVTRSVRDAEADTVPSRWLVRILNLLNGASEESRTALETMSARGDYWIKLAQMLDSTERLKKQLHPAHRPSPVPPLYAQPKELPVTDVERLIRDPYAVYAHRVLGLRKLSALKFLGDPRDHGTALHAVMEEFLVGIPMDIDATSARQRLFDSLEKVLKNSGVPTIYRRIWSANVAQYAEGLVAAELSRIATASHIFVERKGAMEIAKLGFKLTAKADRIDQLPDETFHIFDYKSSPPSAKQIEEFNRQLHFEAAILALGAFEGIGQGTASNLSYVGLNKKLEVRTLPVDNDLIQETLEGLETLIGSHIRREVGYTAKRAVLKTSFSADFDHLAREGEWDMSDTAVREDLT